MSKNKIAKYDSNTNNREVSEQVIYVTDHSAKLQLHEEKLDITKKWIKTGEVAIHKEVFTEEKNITIPVIHEELIIEKKVLDAENPDKTGEHTEIIRIPISEERIEIIKHPTVLEDVEIYKRQFHETKSVKEVLKKEKLYMETTGNTRVVDKNTEN